MTPLSADQRAALRKLHQKKVMAFYGGMKAAAKVGKKLAKGEKAKQAHTMEREAE